MGRIHQIRSHLQEDPPSSIVDLSLVIPHQDCSGGEDQREAQEEKETNGPDGNYERQAP